MPRKPVPIISDTPYHICARCINKEWFVLPVPVVWDIMSDFLAMMSRGFSVRIHSFVLMSNHFHLVATPTENNLSEALLYFMRETSREITRLSGRINQTYGMRNHKTQIFQYHYFMNTYKYVYRNPVRAGICERVEDYPYSTLRGLLGQSRLIIPLEEDTLLFDSVEQTLQWLNQAPESEADKSMRLALRRPIFKFPRNKTSKASRWETELI